MSPMTNDADDDQQTAANNHKSGFLQTPASGTTKSTKEHDPTTTQDAVEMPPDDDKEQNKNDTDDQDTQKEEKEKPAASNDDDDDDHVAAEEDDTDPSSSSSSPIMLTDPFQPIPVWVETIIRMTTASFVAYCLGVATGLDHIIPASQQYLVGLLGSILAIRLPTVTAVIGMTVGLLTVIFVLVSALTTALLSAVSVSDGLLLAMTALVALWTGGLRYGKYEKVFGFLTSLVAAIVGLFTFSLYQTVKRGFAVTGPIDEYPERILDLFGEQVPEFLNGTNIDGNATFVVPGGQFQGQRATVIFDEDTLTIIVKGGLWVVAKYWNAGVMHPLAFFPNFFAIWGWSILCYIVSPLLPPFRTMRFTLSRLMVPQTLLDAAWFIRRQSGEQESSSIKSVAELTPEEQAVRLRLVMTQNIMFNGNIAAMTAYEPRFLDNLGRLPRCTWIKLKQLIITLDTMSLKALTMRLIHSERPENQVVEHVIETLEKSAQALQQQEKNSFLPLKAIMGDEKDETGESEKKSVREDLESIGKRHYEDSLRQASQAVAKAVQEWLESLHPANDDDITFKDGLKNFFMNVIPWCMPAIYLLSHLFIEIPLSPFLVVKGKRQFNADKVCQIVKFAIGYTALAAMVIYWDDYRTFNIVGPNDAQDVAQPTSFSGWLMVAYCFSTMPTTEGSVKKSFQRFIGTCFGCLSAWLLLLATGENVIGMVAWLTVATVIGVYFSVEKNAKARMGPSSDRSYGGFYFVITQVVIALEWTSGDYDDRGELVVTRLVANLIGIALATLMSLIPLRTMGSSPRYVQRILDEIVASSDRAAELVLEHADPTEMQTLHATYMQRVHELREDAFYLMDDASRLSAFPFLKVDPALGAQFAGLTATSFGLASLMEHATRVLELDDDAFAEGSEKRAALQRTALASKQPDRRRISTAKIDLSGGDAEFFVAGYKILRSRIGEHQDALDGVKWWKGVAIFRRK